MRRLARLVMGLAALVWAAPAMTAERAIIVLDGSGSMWAQIDGKARIEIARETLDQVLMTLPAELELGFMTYGHRQKGDCADIEMLVEPAAGTGAAISAAADAINPVGMTPISDAVRLAAEGLRFTEERATVILITDGLETCNVDPCALGAELEAMGIDFTAHVVGFGLSDAEGQQVKCLAENTGGKYLPAGDAAALADALTQTVAEVAQVEPTPVVAPMPDPVAPAYNIAPTATLAEDGPLIEDERADLVWEWFAVNPDGSKGAHLRTEYYSSFKGTVEPGQYIMSAKMGYAVAELPLSIEPGVVAEPHFVLNAARLIVRPRATTDGDIDSGATVVTHWPGDMTTTYGATDIVVPAGEWTLAVTVGSASVSETLLATAGTTIEKDVVVGVGRLVLSAAYVEGLMVEDDSMFVRVAEAKKALDGSRREVTYAYDATPEFDLAPGDYVALIEFGEVRTEAPFSIATDERTELNVVLNAGVLAVTAPGYDFVEVFGAAKDIQGNRKGFGYAYGGVLQTTLVAGEYILVAHPAGGGGAAKEMRVTIVAGQRAEVMVQ